MQKLSNKHSAKVICRFGILRTAHSKRAVLVMKNLSASHAFDYLVLRANPGLTCCKDLAIVMDNSLGSS